MTSTTTAHRPRPRQFYIAREGFSFVAIVFAVSIVLWLIGTAAGAIFMLLVTVFVALFFRNPERNTPQDAGIAVAPADGRVLGVDNVKAPYTGEDSVRISTFMSVFNVHINRLPVSGKVEKIVYHPGKFLVASVDKASELNERNGMVIVDERGRRFTMVQIAGLVARRIVCYLNGGDMVFRGERMGLIRFGSRVDLHLPPDAKIEVKKGDRVKAGETVMARM